MNIINLTTHPITDATTGIEYKPSGMVVRAEAIKKQQEEFGDLNVLVYNYKLYKGTKLPPKKPNTVYIVSNMALNAIPLDRTDFVGPGPVEKDENGKPFACRGFRAR